MNKDLKDAVKLSLVVVLLGALLLAAAWEVASLRTEVERLRNAPADTVTVIRHDTIKVDSPVPVYRYIRTSDTVTIRHQLRDTVKELVFLPRECLVYKDSTYRAVVSGVQPRLDSIEIYRPTIERIVTKTVPVPDRKRWGLGVQAGAGWNGKKVQPYIGVGVSYDLIRW